jgi:hypothetical protein
MFHKLSNCSSKALVFFYMLNNFFLDSVSIIGLPDSGSSFLNMIPNHVIMITYSFVMIIFKNLTLKDIF